MGKKQAELEGFERDVNKELEVVMEILDSKRKAKTKASNAHKDAEKRVIDVMRAEKLTEYTSVDLGLTVYLDEAPHAKLSAYHPPDENKGASRNDEDA